VSARRRVRDRHRVDTQQVQRAELLVRPAQHVEVGVEALHAGIDGQVQFARTMCQRQHDGAPVADAGREQEARDIARQ
jgi:hypothetical protein